MPEIVVATDLSGRALRAVGRAARVAQRDGSRLVLLHVVDDDQPASLVAEEARAAETLLSETAAGLGLAHAPEVVVATGHAAEAIGRVVRDRGADLLVMGAHRRRLLMDFFAGTTIERVIRSATGPVLMANGDPTGPYRSVVVGVDMGEASLRAIQAATALGLLDGARVVLVHAFRAPEKDMMVYAGVAQAEVRAKFARDAAAAWQALGAFAEAAGGPAADAETRVLEGDPAPSVVAVAEEVDADLVVVGTRSASGLNRLVLGSVAEMLLRSIERDVLAVPPPHRG